MFGIGNRRPELLDLPMAVRDTTSGFTLLYFTDKHPRFAGPPKSFTAEEESYPGDGQLGVK